MRIQTLSLPGERQEEVCRVGRIGNPTRTEYHSVLRVSPLLPLALLLIGTATAATAAEEQFDPAARAKIVAPFIDEQTIVVAHIDLTRVNIDALVDKAAELNPELTQNGATEKAGMNRVLNLWLKAGVKELYFIVSLADMDFRRGPLVPFIVPLQGVDEKALAAMLAPSPYEVKKRLGDVFFAGHRETLERIEGSEPDERPELADAFEAAGDTAAQVLFLPPKYVRRVIEEMMPELPKEIGGGSSRLVTQGALWAALGVDLPPRTALRLVIQSEDQQAAAALREKWLQLYEIAGEQDEIRRHAPNFDKIVALLTPTVEDDRLTLLLSDQNGGITSLTALLTPPVQSARRAARRAAAMNNLKHIGLGMQNHHSAQKRFPAAASYDADGKPLLSWRVHILPYIEHYKLYKQFHLDEPWDSPHNRTLIDRMPAIYRSPTSKLKEKGLTPYLAPVGKETVFFDRKAADLKQITDGSSWTIMVVEADDDRAVVWTKPEDLAYDPENPKKGLGGIYQGGFNAVSCDGASHRFDAKISPDVLRAWFTRAGGERIGWKDGKMHLADDK